MKATIEIVGVEMAIEFDFEITVHGNGGTAPSLSYHGDPPEPAEYNLELLSLRFPKQAADVPDLEMPEWLKNEILTHLYGRDEINDKIQQADQQLDYSDYGL